jgi:uncharacterized protein (TIGR04255 family)
MGKVYRNPPIVEALCELHFDKHTPWDVTIFGDYYHRVREEFSQKRELPQMEMAMQTQEGGITSQVRPVGVRMQFVRPDQTALIQLAPHVLIVNQLSPYPTWETFRALILDRLQDYQEVVPDANLQGALLRYINRFNFPTKTFTVGQAFADSDFIPLRLREKRAPFFLRLEMPQEVNSRLLLTLGTIENENPERITVLLDIAAQLKRVTIMDQDRLSKLLDQAHEDIEEVFESCLTDTLREQFDTEV